jgi:hypothetical protein
MLMLARSRKTVTGRASERVDSDPQEGEPLIAFYPPTSPPSLTPDVLQGGKHA